MKRISLVLILMFCFLLADEGYVNIDKGTPSSSKHELLSNLRKITFSNGNVNFELYNKTVIPEAVTGIEQLYFSSVPYGDQSLPVELSGFRAIQKGNDVILSWETASELNNLGFEIQRAHGGGANWEKVKFVEGEGNSSVPVYYHYTDAHIAHYRDLKYRLKQLDYDGTFEYSPEVVLNLEKVEIPTAFRLEKNYPNPFNPRTVIAYELACQNFITLKIYDTQGNEVQVLVAENQNPGRYQIEFDGAGLSSGVYFCRLTSQRDIKITKMLLLK
ncbi:MAG: T9SS type A sorting domain-containing protein [Candidatus Marinimicrobia bacterium]|nr:T9SS type A sorting domain-containing protein [Candidatus Neomarinimicrobiota bacterium]